MYKGFLFFDIDGTLEDSYRGKGITEITLQALQKAKENGYACLISSGRSLGGLRNYTDLMDGFVFSDGAGIMIKGEEPILTPIRRELLDELKEMVLHQLDGGMLMATLYKALADPHEYQGMAEIASRYPDRSTEDVMKDFGVFHLEEYNGEAVLEIDVSFPSEEVEQEFIRRKNPQLDYVSTSASYGRAGRTSGEVTMRGITKGTGAMRLVERFGGTMENTYAFGDSMNDASVLQACRYGVAMGNSCDELKFLADYVAEDIADEGLAKAMEHFGII